MHVIATAAELETFCDHIRSSRFITVDTEFMREHTYYPKLCLLQIAGENAAAIIDPLAPGLDLSPVFELMKDANIIKVFHAARQDVEIFVNLSGAVPAPLFDTQIAAMVCGFGDAVSYDRLVKDLCAVEIDKSSRFTDWSRRPLGQRQLDYALSDVTHLRTAFEALEEKLTANGRADWLADEASILNDPATYEVVPEESWRRIKIRNPKPRTLAVLREISALRELEARRRNQPRNRILRDEVLADIAANAPQTADDLARARSISEQVAKGKFGQLMLEAIKRAVNSDKASWPVLDLPLKPRRGREPVVELLKVLLKLQCEEHAVAQKLVANMSDLDHIADDDHANVPALSGWRREIFGKAAIDLKHGRVALTMQDGNIVPIKL
ncbi:MAG: ribonuclease D [Nisaea sp.]|nr:ribonuclease D [Nisaea sp.]OUX99231.1 MAG: ribonuclease D [Candidatus Endolissoclinum sp. TMED26]|tara:strand:- start:25 stop:1173 length:1149 start_codon:yes stop_codon:yes gene_type:complete